MTYVDTDLYIGGKWVAASSKRRADVTNPATGEVIGTVAHAGPVDFERAVAGAVEGFGTWSRTSAFDRYKVIRKAAQLLRDRLEHAATVLTTDEGKPLSESRLEVASSCDLLDWFAEEGRRTYGRTIPSRSLTVQQVSVKDPVGPCVGFTPWNFPMSQIVRKLGPALAVGCSIIVKGPEEAPAAPAVLFSCLHEAGLPPGVANLLFGTPAEISQYLVPHPAIRKISFTGSVPVGKQLAALAGQHMKRTTMELGGHAPVIVAEDANIEAATSALIASKFRNAGQVCISPTRFLIHRKVHDEFVEAFVSKTRALKVADGLAQGTQMGPLISERRRAAVEALIEDAVSQGATIATGGERVGNVGYFFAPTVVTNVTSKMRAMNEEPFGPVAWVRSYSELDEAVDEANRLPFGLGSYAWTSNAATARKLAQMVQAGMLTINHNGLGLPETPYGGIKDSGHGYEGGSEALEAYLNTRFVTMDSSG